MGINMQKVEKALKQKALRHFFCVNKFSGMHKERGRSLVIIPSCKLSGCLIK